MTYTDQDLNRDMGIISEFAAIPKPDDVFVRVQWEMARTHKLIVRYWQQIYKQFSTSAPVDDAENYLGYADHWVKMVQIHHQLEEEIQFPMWGPYLDTSKDHTQHEDLLVPLKHFQEYLSAIATKTEPWSATKAEEHAQAVLPPLMLHLVHELHTLDPDALRRSGLTEDTLRAVDRAVGEKARTLFDMAKDVPAMLTHNDGATDWPPVPWPITPENRMPLELYKAHEGWWKYSTDPLKV
ncbi:hypothetical protein SCP_1203580 [Sparassis crispa]|uniref:Hemerythrin-like domain-containing protein n=1 Tax=Sparassis crispa TaxID=139825 RepID=A0A401H136_9APHY|nr:hypothetical protein SCP_1203580 [Sparassis crispa]GBE88128.1 hypothetical protein SCP_1203580 [Sparassis crispa]